MFLGHGNGHDHVHGDGKSSTDCVIVSMGTELPSQYFQCQIERWLAWAPGLNSIELWEQWAKDSDPRLPTEGEDPPVSFLPIAMRKKLSSVTKISLWLAHHILTPEERQNIPTVFASRHGEGLLTVELLHEIRSGEPLSPMSFSRSVHNAASGLFGIANKNQAPSTAIAAMERSFEMGFLEAVMQLQKYDRVLFVMADEGLMKEFGQYLDESWGAYGVALLISRGVRRYRVNTASPLPPAVGFLRECLLSTGTC